MADPEPVRRETRPHDIRRTHAVPMLILAAIVLPLVGCARALEVGTGPAHPASELITGIDFDLRTVRNVDIRGVAASRSDNWAITWAADGEQLTTWGDGGGFGGDNTRGRVTMGIARIVGGKDDYRAHNIWGGVGAPNDTTFGGKSYGIVSVDGILYLWRSGDRSDESMFAFQELRRSRDGGASWEPVGVEFTREQGARFFAPTFLQYGRDYAGARDGYVYSYAPEQTRSANPEDEWDVQRPGHISLFRAPRDRLTDPDAYEFFAGVDSLGQPEWTRRIGARRPVFKDERNGVMRTSVSYNAGLGRYLLITQHVSRFRNRGARIGIYEAPEPWGPWSTVLYADPWEVGTNGRLHQDRDQHSAPGPKTVYWNFANRWLSPDGRRFVMVYTGPGSDEWGTVEGTFRLSGRAGGRAGRP